MRASIIVALVVAVVPARARAVPEPDPGSYVTADDDLAGGTIAIRIQPASQVAVSLVGYHGDQTVTVATHTTDARGEVTFDHLDRTGRTAYYAMALVPSGRAPARMLATAIVLPAKGGEHVTMYARSAVDELAKVDAQAALPAGTVRVGLAGAPDPSSLVILVDAATGKILAHGATSADHVDLQVAARAGEVVYAETRASGRRYRSVPFQVLANAGSTVEIYVVTPVTASYRVVARADDPELDVDAEVAISNNSWTPYELHGELPLPRGFTHARLAYDYEGAFAVTATGIAIRRPLAPAERKLTVSFRIPATSGKVTWSLDLPFGSLNSQVAIAKEPGVTISAPTAFDERDLDGDVYYARDKIDILPGQAMVFGVTIPALPPIERACRKLAPDRGALVGKPMLALPVVELDGKPLDPALLRGKPSIVTFTASWTSIARPEPAALDALVRAVPAVTALLVYSDANPGDVRQVVDAHARYRVALDRPHGDENIGPVTTAWGTKLVPESYVIDRRGIVRYYFVNVRDWGSPEAIACLRALAAP